MIWVLMLVEKDRPDREIEVLGIRLALLERDFGELGLGLGQREKSAKNRGVASGRNADNFHSW